MQTVVERILTNYEVYGKERLPELVILHGWGRNLNDWRKTAEFLASKYRVWTLDLPGFGSTGFPENLVMGTRDYSEFVEGFLKKMDIARPILLGHSLGGRIGILLGTKAGLLSKLVLIDSAGIEERGFLIELKILVAKVLKGILPSFLAEPLRSKFGSEDYKFAGLLRRSFVKIVNENLRSYLGKIMTETLIVWGERDTVQDISLAKIMRNEISRAKLRVVWEADHHPHLEKPQDFQEILEEELLNVK